MFLVFLAKSTLKICGISVIRLQIPITPYFTITDYKVQRATFQLVVFDLHKNSKLEDKSLYKKF